MSKKTLTPADRERIRQEAAERKQARENRTMYILCAITLVILLAVIVIPRIYDAVTLPVEISDLDDIQANWVVIDTDSKVSKRYHHPASFDFPQGYGEVEQAFGTTGEKRVYSKYNDGVARDFFLTALDETAPVSNVYVDAAADLTAEAYITRCLELYDSALNEGTSITQVGEPFSATIAGEEAQCLYLRYSEAKGNYGVLICAFDAPRNVCVYAQLTGAYTAPETVQTQEELLAQAQTLLAGLTIVD
jgi:hypothetical protein